jgi:histidyl-tRNA synthetase
MSTVQNIKGMRDHLPAAMLLRNAIVRTLTRVSELHGFEPLQTPIVEYAETLEGKLGDDEKLIYRFEDQGGRRLALRYDQTVPLARVVAQYAGQLNLPWRRYAYGPSYRGERPARGRYREFYQFDLDIVGSSSALADAEIVAILCRSLSELGFPEFTTLLNHRQIIGGIARVSGLDDAAAGRVYRAIDKFDKIGADGVARELIGSGVSEAAAARIIALIQIDGTPAEVLAQLEQHLAADEQAVAAIENLRAIIAGLVALGVPTSQYQVAPRLARGLSYYTGLVFEAVTSHWPEGSLLGGGRYDELIGQFAGRRVPTVGLAFGIDRLHDVMTELKLGPQQLGTTAAYVTVFSHEQLDATLELVQQLRAAGVNCVMALEPGNLGRQLKEADRRGIRFAVVYGPDEQQSGEAVVKDLQANSQQRVKLSDLAAALR